MCASWTLRARRKKINIDLEYIQKFRNAVSSNSHFVYQQFHNVNSKDLWKQVCSCMDWITVAVRHLMNLGPISKEPMVRIMEVFTAIGAIDIVLQSVEQLHRILIDPNTKPFDGERAIFQNRLFQVDDNDYFKELRACFGAHPVKLRPRGRTETRFASWPFEPHSGKGSDLQVRLYSSDVNQSDLLLGISFSELEVFLQTRYHYLVTLTEAIGERFAKFCAKLAARPIVRVDDPIAQLKILELEVQERLKNDYYAATIEELILLFSTSLASVELHNEELRYKKELLLLVDEIYENLQDMNIKDFKYGHLLNPDYGDLDIGYALEKIYGWTLSGSGHPLLKDLFGELNQASSGKYEFAIQDGRGLTHLKVQLFLFGLGNVS